MPERTDRALLRFLNRGDLSADDLAREVDAEGAGLGPTLAAALLAERERLGGRFARVEQVAAIPRFGARRLAALRAAASAAGDGGKPGGAFEPRDPAFAPRLGVLGDEITRLGIVRRVQARRPAALYSLAVMEFGGTLLAAMRPLGAIEPRVVRAFQREFDRLRRGVDYAAIVAATLEPLGPADDLALGEATDDALYRAVEEALDRLPDGPGRGGSADLFSIPVELPSWVLPDEAPAEDVSDEDIARLFEAVEIALVGAVTGFGPATLRALADVPTRLADFFAGVRASALGRHLRREVGARVRQLVALIRDLVARLRAAGLSDPAIRILVGQIRRALATFARSPLGRVALYARGGMLWLLALYLLARWAREQDIPGLGIPHKEYYGELLFRLFLDDPCSDIADIVIRRWATYRRLRDALDGLPPGEERDEQLVSLLVEGTSLVDLVTVFLKNCPAHPTAKGFAAVRRRLAEDLIELFPFLKK